MEPKRGPLWELGEGYSYVGLGCSFAAGIVFFMALGWLLDRWLGLTPLLTIVGTLVGTALSFVSVWARLEADRLKRERGKQEKEREEE